MDDALRVRGRQALRDLAGQVGRLAHRQRALARRAARQRLAFEQLRHDVGDAGVDAHVEHRHDVRVIEGGRGPRFLLEALHARSALSANAAGSTFIGDAALQAGVVREIDLAHATGAEGLTDFVRTEPPAGRKSQRAIIASSSCRSARLASRHRIAFARRQLAEQRGQPPRHRADAAVADRAAVDVRDRGELAHRAGAEHLVGAIDLGQREVASPRAGDVVRAAQFEDGGAGDAFGTGDGAAASRTTPRCDEEQVRGVGFGDEAARVEHQRVVGAGGVGFDLGQDRLDQVVVVDLRVEAVGRKAADAAGDRA